MYFYKDILNIHYLILIMIELAYIQPILYIYVDSILSDTPSLVKPMLWWYRCVDS